VNLAKECTGFGSVVLIDAKSLGSFRVSGFLAVVFLLVVLASLSVLGLSDL
jgi:hypothetical protein